MKKMRRMPLLASMALAATAFAAPAVAQGEAYWTHGEGQETVAGEGEGTAVELEGELSTSVLVWSLQVPIRLHGEVHNGPEMGEGSVSAEATGPGILPGLPPALDCTIDVTFPGQPWNLTLTPDEDESAGTEDATLDLTDIRLVTHYNHGCQTAGTGNSVASTGDLTTTVSSNGDVADVSIVQGDLTFYDQSTGKHLEPAIPVGFVSNPDPLILESTEGGIGVEQH